MKGKLKAGGVSCLQNQGQEVQIPSTAERGSWIPSTCVCCPSCRPTRACRCRSWPAASACPRQRSPNGFNDSKSANTSSATPPQRSATSSTPLLRSRGLNGGSGWLIDMLGLTRLPLQSPIRYDQQTPNTTPNLSKISCTHLCTSTSTPTTGSRRRSTAPSHYLWNRRSHEQFSQHPRAVAALFI